MKRLSAVAVAAAVCMMLAGTAKAETNIALQGIGLKAGVVNPENVDATFGASLLFDLGTVSQRVAMQSYMGYWSQTTSVGYGYDAGVKDFNFGGKAMYMFPVTNPTIQPYAGAGLGFHVVNAHVDSPAVYFGGTLMAPATTLSDTNLKVGLDLGGGLKIDRGNRFAFVGDFWYTVVSDVNHFSLMLGAVYMFGR